MVTFGKHMDGSSDRHTYFSIEVFELEFSPANSDRCIMKRLALLRMLRMHLSHSKSLRKRDQKIGRFVTFRIVLDDLPSAKAFLRPS